MKRVIFAWVTFGYLFDTKEELDAFQLKNKRKYWFWDEPDQERNDQWYIEVRKPYNDRYNPGW